MSLADLRKLTEEGVTFRSHVDGSRHMLSPGDQHGDPAPARIGHRDGVRRMPGAAGDAGGGGGRRCGCRCAGRSAHGTPSATGRGMRCSASCRAASTRELREESAEALTAIGFDGYAIGGLAVGEGQAAMFGVLDYAPGALPDDRPRYLMGVGKPDDIVGAVQRGRGHVRLRAADAVGTDRPGADPARRGEPEERPSRRGPAAARSGLRLPDLPRVQPGLSAPCGAVGRDHRGDAADLAQPALLPGADGRAARRHRRAPAGGVRGGVPSPAHRRGSGAGLQWDGARAAPVRSVSALGSCREV